MYQLETIFLELTSKCNFNCKLCARTVRRHKPDGDMPRNVLDAFICQISSVSSLQQINLMFQGEPLLYADIEYALNCLAVLPQKKILYSNGSLLDKHRILLLLENKIDEIVLSIDGITQEECQHYRPEIDLEFLLRCIEEFKILRGSRYKTIISVSKVGFMNDIPNTKRYMAYWSKKVDKVRINRFWDYENSKPLGLIHSNCTSPTHRMVVSWNGDIIPCCYDTARTRVFGNITDNTISEIWENKLYQAFRQRVKDDKEPLCQTCDWVEP